MGSLFESYNIEAKKGEDYTIGDFHNAIFISETDRIFCYQGLYLNDEDGSSTRIFKQPHYLRKYHSTDAEILNDGVKVTCRKCGASRLIPTDSRLGAHAFLNADALYLE